MNLYIDSANLKEIQNILQVFPVEGVTTNPTLLSKEKANPMQQLKEIRALIGQEMELHAQLLSQTTADMVKEAEYIREQVGQNTFIKIPVTQAGIGAMKRLNKSGISITATAIYTPMQAVVAAKAGARWTAPYVNRLDMIGADGVKVAMDIHQCFAHMNENVGVLAASFKNVEQVLKLTQAGIGAVTAAPEIIEQLLYHPLTDKAVADFTKDFESITQEGITLLQA